MPKTSNGIEYTVRESKRAKRVLVTVSPTSHVEMVIPLGYQRKGLPELIEGQSDWIVKQLKQFCAINRSLKPETIDLKTMGQRWSVKYSNRDANHLSIQESPSLSVTLDGDVDDLVQVNRALNGWVRRKAQIILGEWLETLSNELSIPFNRLTIRRQRTRWGSCSKSNNISLNQNLMFLPRSITRYVLIHELCHVKQPNHGPNFWRLVEEHVKNSKSMGIKTRKTGCFVPGWANP